MYHSMAAFYPYSWVLAIKMRDFVIIWERNDKQHLLFNPYRWDLNAWMSLNIHDRQILYLRDLKACYCHFKDGNIFLAYERFTSHCDRRCGCRIYRGHQFQLLAVTPFCLQQLHSHQVTFFLPAFPLFLDTGVSSGTRPGRGKTHAHRKDGDTEGTKE